LQALEAHIYHQIKEERLFINLMPITALLQVVHLPASPLKKVYIE
jgi:hypothetical protein